MRLGRPAACRTSAVAPSWARLLAVVLALVALVGAGAARALADASPPAKRIALVIGIDTYLHAGKLRNPINDARAIGEALHSLDFQVTELLDPDERQMAEGIRAFGIAAQTAEAALVYYAGHGVQFDHENYLLPADAQLQRSRDLLYEALPLSLLLGEVSQASKIGIVLLDSCRDNPFVERLSASLRQSGQDSGISVGLARVDSVPRNTLVAMATRANDVAEDGTDHSPFAAALMKGLQVPGLELGLFFRNIHDGVLAATKNRQEPYVFSSLGAEPFFLHPKPPSHPPEIGPVAPLEVADNAGPTPLGMPRPTDADGNPLTIRIVGLPRAGDVRIAGQPVARNAAIPLDSFMTATYQPDGKALGLVGSLDILIEDGQGNSVAANLMIEVLPSHHPAVVEAARLMRIYPQALGIVPPTSPDGDKLTVVVRALPRGLVRNGEVVLRVGDRLAPDDLVNLSFMPEPGFSGSAGILLYGVDNGRGDIVEGRIDIEVAAIADPAARISLAELWDKLRKSGGRADFDAFLRLFPTSGFAAEARAAANAAPSPPAPVAQVAPAAPPQEPPPPAPPPAAEAAAVPGVVADASPPPTETSRVFVVPSALQSLPPLTPQPVPAEPTVVVTPPEPPKPAPEQAEAALGLSIGDWAAVQRDLASLGYSAGTPDGSPGAATRRAVLEYQRSQGLARTGYLDRRTRQSIEDAGHAVTARRQREEAARQEMIRQANAEAAAKAAARPAPVVAPVANHH